MIEARLTRSSLLWLCLDRVGSHGTGTQTLTLNPIGTQTLTLNLIGWFLVYVPCMVGCLVPQLNRQPRSHQHPPRAPNLFRNSGFLGILTCEIQNAKWHYCTLQLEILIKESWIHPTRWYYTLQLEILINQILFQDGTTFSKNLNT